MYIEQLYYFETLSKYTSINQASEALFISQPSLSRAITKLEKELNLELVQRSNKKCVLTDDGKEILKHATKIMEEISNIYRYASERNEKENIYFLSIPGICDSIIADSISLYQRVNKNRKIHLKFDTSESILESLKRGNDDLGLISVIRHNEIEPSFVGDDSLEAQFIFSDSIMYWMSSEHQFANSEPSYNDYAPYLFSAVANTSQIEDYTVNTLVFASINFHKKLILQNDAILLLPHNLTYKDPDVATHKIVIKPLEFPCAIDYYLVYKNKSSQIVDEFRQILLTFFSSYSEK